MERFAGAKAEKPKLVPVSTDLDTYVELLRDAAIDSENRIGDLRERAEQSTRALSRTEKIFLAQYPTDADSAFARGYVAPLTHDVAEDEKERIKALEGHMAELRAMNEDIEEGRVPTYEGIRAAKEALHFDQVGLSDAEERLRSLERRHNAGEQMSPAHYRVMRQLSEEVALRRERIKRMSGRISMFGEVLHAQEQEHGGGPAGTRRAHIERRSSRLMAKARNSEILPGAEGLEGEEEDDDRDTNFPPMTGGEIAA